MTHAVLVRNVSISLGATELATSISAVQNIDVGLDALAGQEWCEAGGKIYRMRP